MKLLLDTHTFLWMDNASRKLPLRVKELCQDPQNELVLSIVSIWEIQIKAQLGKLELRTSLAQLISEQRDQNGVGVLPITLSHVLALQTLPMHHKDPFDRLLVCQAKTEKATLLSKDQMLANYSVDVVW